MTTETRRPFFNHQYSYMNIMQSGESFAWLSSGIPGLTGATAPKAFELFAVQGDGRARYGIKRGAGISAVRYGGSVATRENDRQSYAAEQYAASKLNADFNSSLTVHGDGGPDFKLGDKDVEIIWSGFEKGSPAEQRVQNDNLLVNPEELHRWADIYVGVSGSVERGFTLMGWTTHRVLVIFPK
jgi:hypothetical protein